MRPENGLFFANAEGIREEILSEMQASEQPVKAVLLDLSATTDLDVPGAETLELLYEDLHSRNVRLIWVRMIMPVRQMLAQAGVMAKIRPEDVYLNPPEAVLDYLSAQGDSAGVQELLRSAAASVRGLLEAHALKVPAEREAALAAVVENLDPA